MYNFIVIGNPIAHSKSPQLHISFAEHVGIDISYTRQFCPDNRESFRAVVEAFFNGGGSGANVTVPFKQEAYNMLCGSDANTLTHYAKVAGAVNTLYIKDGVLSGHNTDGLGLLNHLTQLGWFNNLPNSNNVNKIRNKASQRALPQPKKVAIIGAGGASRGIILPLVERGVTDITIANRTVSKAEQLVDDCFTHFDSILSTTDRRKSFEFSQTSINNIREVMIQACAIEELTGNYDLIINATSIGLSQASLPLKDTLSCTYAYDMMYGKTLPFLEHFTEQGSQVSDGYGMLLHQAILSFQLWTGKAVDVEQLIS